MCSQCISFTGITAKDVRDFNPQRWLSVAESLFLTSYKMFLTLTASINLCQYQFDGFLIPTSTILSQSSHTPCVTTFIGFISIQYKLGTMVFKCLRRMAPSYLADMCTCRLQLVDSTSPFCRPSRSDNSTQSIGAIWNT